MESGTQPSLADSTTCQVPRMLQEEQNELEEITPTSLGQVSEELNDDDDKGDGLQDTSLRV